MGIEEALSFVDRRDLGFAAGQSRPRRSNGRRALRHDRGERYP
jgi:hypothetical protein